MKDLIIQKQEELIKFYEDYLSSIAVYLSIHHMEPTDELVKKGQQIRKELALLQEQDKPISDEAIEEWAKKEKYICNDKCKWWKIGYGHCNFCIRRVNEHDCKDNHDAQSHNEHSRKFTSRP